MQYTKKYNTTRIVCYNQNAIRYRLFLVYSFIHNVTLLKCMRKALYYTKKLSSHFLSVTIFVRPWWKENNVI